MTEGQEMYWLISGYTNFLGDYDEGVVGYTFSKEIAASWAKEPKNIRQSRRYERIEFVNEVPGADEDT